MPQSLVASAATVANSMKRNSLHRVVQGLGLGCAMLLFLVPAAWSQSAGSVPLAQRAPHELISAVTQDILDTVKNDRSLQQRDLRRISELVDQKVMPVVNFSRMTALAVGRHWRSASPEQQQKLVLAFRDLLVLTYSEALRYVQESTIEIRPARYLPTDEDVVVRTLLLRSGKEPIPLDYRLQKTAEGWKIYDFNVLGLWIVEHYRSQFGQLVSAKGIDGLIQSLEQKNQALRQAMASGKG
jgi:phospholipid transport system substrate-binding protein